MKQNKQYKVGAVVSLLAILITPSCETMKMAGTEFGGFVQQGGKALSSLGSGSSSGRGGPNFNLGNIGRTKKGRDLQKALTVLAVINEITKTRATESQKATAKSKARSYVAKRKRQNKPVTKPIYVRTTPAAGKESAVMKYNPTTDELVGDQVYNFDDDVKSGTNTLKIEGKQLDYAF